MKIIKFSFFTLMAFIFIVFCVVNREPVSISLFPIAYSFSVPLFVLAICCIVVGVIVTGIAMNIKFLNTYNALRKTTKRMKAMENENVSLRSERERSFPALTKQP